MIKTSVKAQLSEFVYIYLYFHLYNHYITLYTYIYILVKLCSFGFILKRYATDMHFSSQYVITIVCLAHAHSLYAILTMSRNETPFIEAD
jgi:hypothetical protein